MADGVVKVPLAVPCGSCPISIMTLKMGTARTLMRHFTDLKKVVPVD